jgi:hypothetical protein
MFRRMRPPGFAMRHIKTFMLSAALAAALAACERSGLQMTETPVLDQQTASANCDAKAETAWEPGPAFSLTAQTTGPDCAKAVVLLTVRHATQDVAVAWASPVQHVFGLKDATTVAEMEAALADFVQQRETTTADLPEWTGDETLPGGEFPFHPEEWIDRATYDTLRTQAAPMLAFPQGHESLAVYALRDGYLESIGLQQFPG